MTYYATVMARYILFVLKVPLNPKQAKKTNADENMTSLAEVKTIKIGGLNFLIFFCVNFITCLFFF